MLLTHIVLITTDTLMIPRNTSPALTSPKNIIPHVQLSMGSVLTESPQIQSDQIQMALPFPTNLFFLYPVVGNHIRNLSLLLLIHFPFPT